MTFRPRTSRAPARHDRPLAATGLFTLLTVVACGGGHEGEVDAGTTIDIPGDDFPAFTAVEVPPVSALGDVVDDAVGVRWSSGPDADTTVVISKPLGAGSFPPVAWRLAISWKGARS